MILHLGRDSREKRQAIYKKILESKSASIITPEQATLDLERDIIETLDLKGLLFHDVTSFSRLLSRTVDYFGEEAFLSDVGKFLLLHQVLEELKEELPLYGSSFNKEGFYEELVQALNLFERSGVEPLSLLEMEEERLRELGRIYEAYQAKIRDKNLYDNKAVELFSRLPKGQYYSEDQVWIIGYKAFDYLHWLMIEELNKNSQVNIVLSLEDDPVFSATVRTKEGLERDYSTRLINYEAGDNKAYEFSRQILSEEEEEVIDIEPLVFSAKDPYVEAEFIGLHIIKRLKDNPGLSYRDFKILVSDMESYDFVFRQVFTELGLPLFSDRRRSILESPMIRSFLSLLRALQRGLRREEILGFLKGFLAEGDWQDLDNFENYCFSNGIGGRAFKEAFEDPLMEELREKFLGSLVGYEEEFRHTKKISDFELLLKEVLASLGFAKRLEEEARDYASRDQGEEAQLLAQLWENLMELLAQLSLVGPREEISFTDYISLLESALSKMSLGIIPPAIDSIRLATLYRSTHDPVNYLYFCGLNDGVLPREYKEDLLLKEEDKERLQKEGFLVYDNFENKEELDRLDFLTALSLVEGQYFFSYVLADIAGKSKAPSVYIERILERTEADFISSAHSDRYLKDYYVLHPSMSFRYGLRAVREKRDELIYGLSQRELDEIKEAIKSPPPAGPLKREDKRLYMSISRLERFRLCPFQYFIRDDLRARKRRAYKVDAMDLGNFFHSVMERAMEDYAKGLYKLDGLEDYLSGLARKIIKENPDYRAFEATGSGSFLLKRSLTTLEGLIRYLIAHSLKSSFTPSYFEQSFSIDGERFVFRGIIDRVDVLGDKFLAIDYKTGGKSFDLNRVFQGIDLQLMLYIDGFKSVKEDMMPAGVFYFRLHDPLGTEAKKRDKQLQYSGIFIGDEELAAEYDPELGQGVLPMSLTSKGAFTRHSRVLDPDQAEKLLERSRSFSRSYVDRIFEGDMKILPLYDEKAGPGFGRACDICDYKAICRFDPRGPGGSYSRFEILKDEEIMEALSEVDP